jgi:hypothetical protein
MRKSYNRLNPNNPDVDGSKKMNQKSQNDFALNSQELEKAISALSKITSLSPEEIKPHLAKFLSELSQKPAISENHFFETATDDEWISAFRDWSESHKVKELPVLSEEAMSREAMYPDRW